MNKFMQQNRQRLRDSGYGQHLKPDFEPIEIPDMSMPMTNAEKEPGLFLGYAEYQCEGDRLRLQAQEPPGTIQSWEFQRVKK